MKLLKISLKLIFLIITIAIFISLIWIYSPGLVWNDEIPFESEIARSLLIVTVISTLTIIFLIFRRKKTTEENNNIFLKLNFNNQKVTLSRYVKNVAFQLKLIYKILSNKHARHIRKLPWYLLVGMPQSGKSTLLASADLDFSLDKILNQQLSISEIFSKQHQWHLSKEAAFLEINSQQPYNSEQQDYDWNNLLTLIKSWRRNHPINGLIIAINISELLLQPEKINVSQLKSLKSTLVNIYHQLNIKVPVYIVFTQCDLIAGFTEFFVTLNQEKKQQTCSINLANDNEQFESYYNEFIQKLNEQVLIKIQNERDQQKRDCIFSFPQQMLLFKPILKNYLLKENYAQTRGFYFSSALQTGISYDFLGSVISKKYHFSNHNEIKSFAGEQGFFIKHLFKKNILVDKPIIKNTVLVQNFHRRIAAIVLITLSFSIGFSYVKNKQAIAQLEQILPEYQQLRSDGNSNNSNLLALLPLIDTLQSAQDVYAKTNNYLLLNLELYAPIKIKTCLEKIQRNILTKQFLPSVAEFMEFSLKNKQNNLEVAYQTLKAYLALFGLDKTDKNWIKIPLDYNLYSLNHYQSDDVNKINQYLDEAMNYSSKYLSINQVLLQQVRDSLNALKPAEIAYYELKQNSNHYQLDFDLTKKIKDFERVFSSKNSSYLLLPQIYTFTGYQQLKTGSISMLAKDIDNIYQVLGLNKHQKSFLFDQKITPQLWSLYNTDYIKQWQNSLNNLSIKHCKNLPEAIELLSRLTVQQNPLIDLLITVKKNTLLIHGNNLSISKTFSPLNKIAGVTNNQEKQYQTIQNKLLALRNYLTEINTSPDINKAAFTAAVNCFQGKFSDNPVYQLKQLAASLPIPLNRWLDEISNNAMELLLEGAHKTINTAWQNEVVPIYRNTIQGRFPFNPEINQQESVSVDLNNFGNFFGNNGVIQQFISTYLSPFIDTKHLPWQPYVIANDRLALNSNTISQLQKADEIRQLFFTNNDKTVNYSFSLQPRYLSPEISNFTLQINNQTLTYQHGPQQRVNWRWSEQDGVSQVNISFNDFENKNSSQNFTGPWAFIKLLKASRLKPSDTSGNYIWDIVVEGHTMSFYLWLANSTLLFDSHVLTDFTLPSTI